MVPALCERLLRASAASLPYWSYSSRGSDALHDAGNAVPIAIAAPRQPRPITESRAGDLAVLADS